VPIPSYVQFIEPLLRYLAAHPEGAPAREACEAAADALKLSADDRQERLPSGAQAIYKNRTGWAHDRLKRAGFSSSPRRGYWRLTADGLDYAKRNPTLSAAEVERLAEADPEFRLKPLAAVELKPDTVPPEAVPHQSPDDRLDSALAEISSAVASELLEALMRSTPQFFEVLVLDLLHRMGYGTSREDLKRVGGSGDGGIDGIISLDRLGLEKVYVQAKRWQNSVGRPEVQGFFGALAGNRARKGVFITTSGFTNQALDYARSVEGIVLIDGARLTSLMIEHGVGVTHRAVQVPKVDSDYFED
jgi:restriction system protein